LPQLVAIEEKYGNLWRGLSHAMSGASALRTLGEAGQSMFVTLRSGLHAMVERLRQSLKQTDMQTGCEAGRIVREEEGYRVEHGDGSEEAEAVIVATPAHAAARLLEGLDASLAGELGALRHHSSVIVALGYERREVGRELEGFGFVVPRTEAKSLTACTWVSTKFPFRSGPEGCLLRCFLGENRNPGLLGRNDEEIVADTRRELEEIMQLRAMPRFVRVYRWENRMPQYDVGHPVRVERIKAALKDHRGLFLAGNGYSGVGIPDCIQSGAAAAAAAMEYLG
jgi:oxygen-dependent protoporphyrinogen oxidase